MKNNDKPKTTTQLWDWILFMVNTPIALRALVPVVGWQPIAWAGPTADRCCRYCSPQDFLTFQVRNLMQLQPPEKRGYVVICGYI